MGKKVLVLGGDGFCGWATSLYLSKQGYDVNIIDNLSRRRIDEELGVQSLTPIRSIEERIQAWKEVTGKEIPYLDIDVAEDYDGLLGALNQVQPDVVVHFAEQRSAPYSMRSPRHKRYTIDNNVKATHNTLCAIVESGLDTHLVHLGTAGNNGYVTTPMDIPEGYIDVKVPTDEGDKVMEFVWPLRSPSIYHNTKALDFLMFQFYTANDNVRITDLRQGIVWGTQTPETKIDERLINRFDWEGDYGTVLNRFLMQSQVGHPLTVHGTGGQTRAYINIQDTTKCIEMAIEYPPLQRDKVKIFNQNAETLNVRELAEKVSDMTGAEIRYYENPRKEAAENNLRVATRNFRDLGWDPILLEDGLLEEVMNIAKKYRGRVDTSKIIATSTWRSDIKPDFVGRLDK